MFDIFPLILILISLTSIIVVVVRKFAVLANLDVETIQAEREIRIKEQIISSRLKRVFFKHYNLFVNIMKPVGGFASKTLKGFYDKLLDFKDNYNKDDSVNPMLKNDVEGKKVIAEAEEFKENEEWEEAEKRYIEIIGQDSSNIQAFKGLGQVYFERKDYYEAKETMEHAEKLLEKNYNDLFIKEEKGGLNEDEKKERDKLSVELAKIYFDLSLVEKAIDNLDMALKNIIKALKIQPNNPRYLDTMFELSIINKDKANALEAYKKLAGVNPENQKLEDMKEKLDQL